MNTVSVNGLQFAYLEAGQGPTVMLLHGFPDSPHTWDHQMAALVDAGYRVVAPWLRGYAPTEVPEGGFYDKATLVHDVAGLIRAVGGGGAVHLVGQDWGAIIAYALLVIYVLLGVLYESLSVRGIVTGEMTEDVRMMVSASGPLPPK